MIRQFDIILVNKKTKSKFGDIKKAEPNEMYMVKSIFEPKHNFNSRYQSSTKYFLIDENGEEYFTTESCCERLYNISDYSIPEEQKNKWMNVKKDWMDKTYVPVIVTHFYASNGYPMISSRDESAFLIAPINNGQQMWLSKSNIHDDDIKTFLTSSFPVDPKRKDERSETVSIRIPFWLANGKGMFGKKLSKNVN